MSARLAFLVIGGTGAGKSTLLAAMLGAVPPSERIVSVEDVGELQPDHPQFVRLIARQPNVEGAGEIALRDLVRGQADDLLFTHRPWTGPDAVDVAEYETMAENKTGALLLQFLLPVRGKAG